MVRMKEETGMIAKWLFNFGPAKFAKSNSNIIYSFSISNYCIYKKDYRIASIFVFHNGLIPKTDQIQNVSVLSLYLGHKYELRNQTLFLLHSCHLIVGQL